jgi:putative OPT family oligopeptide transporter
MGDKVLELGSGEITIRRGPYPEFTLTAVLLGWGIGILITISISYACLKLGFSIEGSELAAILGWGILRGILQRTSIVENNINQTIASAVNGASPGIMFCVPALLIISKTSTDPAMQAIGDFSSWNRLALMLFAAIAGAFIGLSFVIPLRKQMIDFQRLPYPGGIAVATILKSSGAGVRKSAVLFGAAAISALAFALFSGFGSNEHPKFAIGDQFGLPKSLNLAFFLSLMTIGVGFLSGKGGFWFGAGGFICYFLLSPVLASYGPETVQELVNDPGGMRRAIYFPTGIGMLVGAAIGGIIMAWPLIASAMRSLRESRSGGKQGAGSDEMPFGFLVAAAVGGAVLLCFLAWQSVPEMTLLMAMGMALLGTLWIWIAGVIVAECVGRTNWSPLSGMTLIAVTILVVVAKSGLDNPATILSSIIVGVAVCMAVAQSSDMMLDLKSGYLVGAIPRRQQIAQYLGAWLGPFIVFGILLILEKSGAPKPGEIPRIPDGTVTYGIGSDDLPAAQATALAATISGIIEGNVPVYRYVAGAALGLMLACSGLGGVGVLVALGFYMPFDIVLTYTIGCILRIVVDKTAGPRFSEEYGIPAAAGLIVGEALIGVFFAMKRVFLDGPEESVAMALQSSVQIFAG